MSGVLRLGWTKVLAACAAACAILVTNSAHAALLGLVPNYPDISSSQTRMVYNWDDANNTGGTLTIQGKLSGNTAYQTISFDGTTSYVLRSAPSGATAQFTNYLLTANFDSAGLFTGGSVSILGYVDLNPSDNDLTNNPPVAGWPSSGTILTGTLTDFGFLGTATANADRDSLRMDFAMTVTGGDIYAINGFTGGVIAAGNVSTLATGGTAPVGGAWTQAAFTQDFQSCASCTTTVDTFVPLPGAVWLFASGVLGFVGFVKRRAAALH